MLVTATRLVTLAATVFEKHPILPPASRDTCEMSTEDFKCRWKAIENLVDVSY